MSRDVNPVSPYVYPGLGIKRQGMILLDFIYDCCDALDVTYSELKGKSRKQDVVFARHCVSHCLRVREKKSYGDIGKLFNRDHATAVHHVRSLFWLMETEDHMRRKYTEFLSA